MSEIDPAIRSPLVTVVLPTRDRVDLLQRAIRSVRNQTLGSWELIVVDDGSSDATSRVMLEYASADRRIRYERNETSMGAPAARNRGATLARTNYLAFLDDDAEWLPQNLERQVAALESAPEKALAYCLVVIRDNLGVDHVVGSAAASGPHPRRELLRGNSIDTSCVVLRKAVFQAVGGFDESLPRLQDWDLWLRLADVTLFSFVREPLARTGFTPGSISTNQNALADACNQLAAKLQSRTAATREELSDGYYALGHMLMMGGVPRVGRQHLVRAIKLRPWPLRRVIMVAAALMHERLYGAVCALHGRAVRRPVQQKLAASTEPPAPVRSE